MTKIFNCCVFCNLMTGAQWSGCLSGNELAGGSLLRLGGKQVYFNKDLYIKVNSHLIEQTREKQTCLLATLFISML